MWSVPRDLPINSTLTASVALTYLAALVEVVQSVPEAALDRVLAVLMEARVSGRRVYVMGNGGSAAIASQFVCNLVKTAHRPGIPPFRVHALTDNIPLLTAW